MRILFIGDISGKPGRRAIVECLSKLVDKENIDFVIANGENAAGGNGITPEIALEFYQLGIDVITLGNHAWDKREIMNYIANDPRMLRPANYPLGTPGSGWGIYSCNSVNIGVISLCGRVYMHSLDCPFKKIDELLSKINDKVNILIVDFHAEATSEKVAMGWYLDGRVTAVLGTHTHIQTADSRVLPKGTGYISDVGMTGPKDSVLGVKPDIVIKKFITQLPQRFEVASGDYQLNAVILDVDTASGKTMKITPVQLFETGSR